MLAWISRKDWHQAGKIICRWKNRSLYSFWNACWMVAQKTLEAKFCLWCFFWWCSAPWCSTASFSPLACFLISFPFSATHFFSYPDSTCINLCRLSSLAGGVSGSHHVHTVCPLHWPVSCRHQRADVLWDDRELHLDHGQAGRHLGGCPPAGPARGGAAPAGQGGPRVQWQCPRRALRGEDLHGTARHHLRAGSHLRRGTALVVLRLLFLFAYPVHYYLLPGDSEENQEGRKSLHKGE